VRHHERGAEKYRETRSNESCPQNWGTTKRRGVTKPRGKFTTSEWGGNRNEKTTEGTAQGVWFAQKKSSENAIEKVNARRRPGGGNKKKKKNFWKSNYKKPKGNLYKQPTGSKWGEAGKIWTPIIETLHLQKKGERRKRVRRKATSGQDVASSNSEPVGKGCHWFHLKAPRSEISTRMRDAEGGGKRITRHGGATLRRGWGRKAAQLKPALTAPNRRTLQSIT